MYDQILNANNSMCTGTIEICNTSLEISSVEEIFVTNIYVLFCLFR